MIGLLEPMKKSMVPVQVQLDAPVVKVASGECWAPGQELAGIVQSWVLGPSCARSHLREVLGTRGRSWLVLFSLGS